MTLSAKDLKDKKSAIIDNLKKMDSISSAFDCFWDLNQQIFYKDMQNLYTNEESSDFKIITS